MQTELCDCKTIILNGETYHRGDCASHGAPALVRERNMAALAVCKRLVDAADSPIFGHSMPPIVDAARAVLAMRTM